jgi:hypothetical protein
LPMPGSLSSTKARELAEIVRRLGSAASFRTILRDAALAGVLVEHKTLRRYLDLMLAGNLLKVKARNVGSVLPQQIYSVNSAEPQVRIGLAVLREYGLNWDIPSSSLRTVSTDFEGLVRSKIADSVLIASLEDCLVHVLHEDATKSVGTTIFVSVMLSTARVDLPYLLRRADEMRLGRAVRLLCRRILESVSSKKTNVPASVFLAVREKFLKIARQYAQTGFWKLAEKQGVGGLGLEIVRNLTDDEIIMAAGKQLGVTG